MYIYIYIICSDGSIVRRNALHLNNEHMVFIFRFVVTYMCLLLWEDRWRDGYRNKQDGVAHGNVNEGMTIYRWSSEIVCVCETSEFQTKIWVNISINRPTAVPVFTFS